MDARLASLEENVLLLLKLGESTRAMLEKMDARLDRIEVRLDQLEVRLDRIEERFDGIEVRFYRLEQRVDKNESSLDTLTNLSREIMIQLSDIKAEINTMKIQRSLISDVNFD